MSNGQDRKKAEESSNFTRNILLLLALAVLVGVIFFGFSLRLIFVDVQNACAAAEERFPGDHVDALIACALCDDIPFKERNRAIWALGQIGDKRALAALRGLKTSEVQKKPYDSSRYIVQYTVDKAIEQCEGTISLTRWMYGWL